VMAVVQLAAEKIVQGDETVASNLRFTLSGAKTHQSEYCVARRWACAPQVP